MMANYGGYDFPKTYVAFDSKTLATEVRIQPTFSTARCDEVNAEHGSGFLDLIEQWRAEFPAEPS